MLAQSLLKNLKSYLSSLNAMTAVYDEELTLQWTSCEGIFGTLDTKIIRDALPIKEEIPLPVTVEGVRHVMNVTPVYRSKRLVSGYVCVLRDSYELYRMIGSSAIADFGNMSLKDERDKLSRIIGINEEIAAMLDNGEITDKAYQLIKDQYKSAIRLYTEITSGMTLLHELTEDEPVVNCNIPILLKGLCTEAAQCLVKTKRKLNKKLDNRNYYTKIDYRIFSAAFLSVFRSHLYISPLKSDISVATRYEEGEYVITVKSEALPQNDIGRETGLKALQDRELARKIVGADCGGSLSFTCDGKAAISVIRVPAAKKNRGAMLNDTNSGYLSGDYRPVRFFVDEITEKEELAVTAGSSADDTDLKPKAKSGRSAGGRK